MDMSRRLQLDLSAPQQARSALADLRESIGDEAVTMLCSIVTELVANCVQHGGTGGEVIVRARRAGGRVRLEVSCPSGSTRPRIIEPGYRGGGSGGLGLRIVDGLAERWGVTDDGASTTVWADVAAE